MILKPNKTYVLVCKTGYRALLAVAVLKKWYKFKNVYVLKGGVKAYIQNGGTITNPLHLGPVKIDLLYNFFLEVIFFYNLFINIFN